MTVDLVQLEIFKAVAEHGSISAAAAQILLKLLDPRGQVRRHADQAA